MAMQLELLPSSKSMADETMAYRELGRTGLKRYAGLVRDEYDPRIMGSKWAKTAREMADSEPIIGATLYVIEMMIRQATWRVEPADDTPEAKLVADHVDSCIGDLLEDGGWQGMHSNMLSCLIYGWAALEKVYKRRHGLDAPVGSMRSKYDDGRVGWRKFAIRAQDTLDRWEFDQVGGTLGWWQSAPPDFATRYLPRGKYLHFVLRQRNGSPEGYSLLRPVYPSYYILKNVKVIEAIGIERHLAGLPVMQVPTSVYSNDTLRTSYLKAVRAIRNDEYAGLVIPAENEQGEATGYKFGLLASGGRSPTDVDEIVKRYESRIAMAMLTQFLLLGQQAVGSYSLADRATDLFAVALGTILDMRDEQFNTDAIPELVDLNGWSYHLCPRLVHGDIETPNLQELAGYITSLVGSGVVTPDAELEAWTRELANLPEPNAAAAMVSQPESTLAPEQVYGAGADVAATQADDTNVQQQALNGAQVASMLEVLQQVAAGTLPKTSAAQLLTVAFPVSQEQAWALIRDIEEGSAPAEPVA